MKNISLILLFGILLTNCSDCDSGIDCCNPEMSKLEISSYLKNWVPYDSPDTILLKSENLEQLIYSVDNLVIKDTSYFQGDECPNRPAQYRAGKLISQNDTVYFSSDGANSFIIEIDKIKFIIADYPNGKHVNPYNQSTTAQKSESEIIVNTEFQDVIIAQSDSGDVRKAYFSYGIGLVGIERNDTIYGMN